MERSKLLLLTSVVFLLNIYSGKGQDTKYKDIYPYITSGRFTEAVPLLTDYLKEDPDNASANLQLALIFEKRFKSYDPISEFDAVIRNAENAKTYFLKAGLLIDEKEIKKNGDKYYTNLARPDEKGRPVVTYSYVKSVIDSAFISIDHYLRSVPDVHANYISAVKYYRQSYEAYLSLNSSYNDLNELYFLYNNSLDKKLAQLKNDFDSCRFFLQKYFDATDIFPLHEFKQSSKVNKIENFRIDGLMPVTDFMDSVIQIWDYAGWADNVKKNYNKDFKPLMDQLNATEESLNKNLDLLSDPDKSSDLSIKLAGPDWNLIHNISGYDPASLAISILLYQDFKQRLLFEKLYEFKSSQDSSVNVTPASLLVYYHKLFGICHEGDSTLELLKKRNNDNNRKKYSVFLEKYFPDNPGLDQFISRESAFVKKNENECIERMQKNILELNGPLNDLESYVMFKKTKLSLFITKFDSANIKPENLYTSGILRSFKNIYVSGFMLPQKSNGSLMAFLAKIDSSKNVEWLNYYNTGSENKSNIKNTIGALTVYPRGVAFILNSYFIKIDSSLNTLHLIKDSGEPDTTMNLTTSDNPRIVSYDERDHSFFITFKGKRPVTDIVKDEPLTWIKISAGLGESLKQQFSFSGEITTQIPMGSAWLLSGNFTKISDPSFQTVTAGSDPKDTKAFAILLDTDGKVKKLKVFNNPDPYYIYTVYKINDGNINLIGIPGSVPESITRILPGSGQQLIHYIFDDNLKVLFYSGDK